MADTLIKLITDIQNQKRIKQKINYKEIFLLDSRINLIYNNLKDVFKFGVEYKYFINILHNEIINCILYDLVLYDYVVINIGIKTLYSLMKDKDTKFNDRAESVPIMKLKNNILDIISVYFHKENIIILFEYSDCEGRMVIKPRDHMFKSRPHIKFIEFPLYNFMMLDSN